MCAGPAAELGVTLSVFAEADDASAALVVPSSPVGDHTEAAAVHAFAQHCDVGLGEHAQGHPQLARMCAGPAAPWTSSTAR